MPKQIFQRPVPVRHDHFVKKDRAGPPIRPKGKTGLKKPVVPTNGTGPLPLPDHDPEPDRRK